MKVFISWSGAESHAMAAALDEWLPQVIQSIKPFFSSEGIRKGASWPQEIGTHLESTNFGILCLTPDNLKAEWLLFEAGALSKNGKNAHVVPLITSRMQPSDLTPPLSLFQVARTTKTDVQRMVETMNVALGDVGLAPPVLSRSFDKWWPHLEQKFAEIAAAGSAKKPAATRRPVEDMVEETLGLVRSIAQQQQQPAEYQINLPGAGTLYSSVPDAQGSSPALRALLHGSSDFHSAKSVEEALMRQRIMAKKSPRASPPPPPTDGKPPKK